MAVIGDRLDAAALADLFRPLDVDIDDRDQVGTFQASEFLGVKFAEVSNADNRRTNWLRHNSIKPEVRVRLHATLVSINPCQVFRINDIIRCRTRADADRLADHNQPRRRSSSFSNPSGSGASPRNVQLPDDVIAVPPLIRVSV